MASMFQYCEPQNKDEFTVFAGITRQTLEPHKESKYYPAAVTRLLERLLSDPAIPAEVIQDCIKKIDATNNELLAEQHRLNEASKSKAPRLNAKDRGGPMDEEFDDVDAGGGKGEVAEILTEEELAQRAKEEEEEKKREAQLAKELYEKELAEEERRRENYEKLQAKARLGVAEDSDISKKEGFQLLKRDDEEEEWGFGGGKGKKGKGKGKR